jgi:hypothetical protein
MPILDGLYTCFSFILTGNLCKTCYELYNSAEQKKILTGNVMPEVNDYQEYWDIK